MNDTLPRVVLFDFGGVLLHLNDPAATFGLDWPAADFNRRWLESPSVRAHESGRIDAHAFASRIVRELSLPYSADEFLARFDRWPDCIPTHTAALVRRVVNGIDCAILSNTNRRHWSGFDIDGTFAGRIGRCFLSFETGLLKPDGDAFRQVIDACRLPAHAILFLDDNPLNVVAAAQAGMRTRVCPGVHALAGILREEGIVEHPA